MSMKSNPFRFTESVLFCIALTAGILTSVYQGWYFLIRAAILLPLLAFGWIRSRISRWVRIVCAVLGSFLFGTMVVVWTVYPIRRAVEGIGWPAERSVPILIGALIGLSVLNLIGFLARAMGRFKSHRWFPFFWGIWIVFLLSQTVLHAFVWKETIGIEWVSYLAFFGALWPMAIDINSSSRN
jgi:hypothetical protein